jgi:CRP-like cAMP-binding protein
MAVSSLIALPDMGTFAIARMARAARGRKAFGDFGSVRVVLHVMSPNTDGGWEMNWTNAGELIGYIAAFFVLATFWMKTMVPLRVIALVSNVLFIAYGYLAAAHPPLILHLALLPLNYVRLREMLRLTQEVKAAVQSDLDMEWLKPFTSAQAARPGDRLFQKGDVAADMFFVVSGRYCLLETGLERGPGEIVGELGMLAPEGKRTQTLECIEGGELLRISYQRLEELYFQNPSFGFYFLELTTRRLFENITELERKLAAATARLRSENVAAHVGMTSEVR